MEDPQKWSSADRKNIKPFSSVDAATISTNSKKREKRENEEQKQDQKLAILARIYHDGAFQNTLEKTEILPIEIRKKILHFLPIDQLLEIFQRIAPFFSSVKPHYDDHFYREYFLYNFSSRILSGLIAWRCSKKQTDEPSDDSDSDDELFEVGDETDSLENFKSLTLFQSHIENYQELDTLAALAASTNSSEPKRPSEQRIWSRQIVTRAEKSKALWSRMRQFNGNGHSDGHGADLSWGEFIEDILWQFEKNRFSLSIEDIKGCDFIYEKNIVPKKITRDNFSFDENKVPLLFRLLLLGFVPLDSYHDMLFYRSIMYFGNGFHRVCQFLGIPDSILEDENKYITVGLLHNYLFRYYSDDSDVNNKKIL